MSDLRHDARQHLVDFIRQVQDEYHAEDLGEIAAAVSPPGWPLEEVRREPSPERIAEAILTGEVVKSGGEPSLTRERDEALDLIEKAWNDGPTFKTLPLGDWLRARGRGPARAALDARREGDHHAD